MKKSVLFIFLILFSFCQTSFCANIEVEECDYNVVLNENDNINQYSWLSKLLTNKYNLSISSPLILYNDSLYVPLRELVEKTDMKLEWDDDSKTAKVDTISSFDVESPNENKNGEDIDIIPDEEIALEIGKILLEKQTDKKLEYEKDGTRSFFNIKYYENIDAWEVFQDFETTRKNTTLVVEFCETPCIIMDKKTGRVLYLNTEFRAN